MQLGEEEGEQREKPGPCDTVKPEWPAMLSMFRVCVVQVGLVLGVFICSLIPVML